MKHKREFQVGDVVRRSGSDDEGRIARIVNNSEVLPFNRKGKSPKGLGYVVSLVVLRHPSIKEALWREEEIALADCS